MLDNTTTYQLESACPPQASRGPDGPFYKWLALGYVFLFILALTANLRVLFKLFHYSRRRFHDHILLLNLCAADLFVTLVYIPSEIYAYTIGRWHNDEVCKILAALKGLGIYVSSCAIIGISLDRYLAIVHPLTVYQSNKRNKLFVVGSWVISMIACVPQLIIFKRLVNEEICREMCGDVLSSDLAKRLAYNIAVTIFSYIAPLIIIFYSYFRILYVLQRRCDRRTFRFVNSRTDSQRSYDGYQGNHSVRSLYKKYSTNGKHKSETNKITKQSPPQEDMNTHNMRTITRAKLKTLKLTALIVICFILCWTPYYCIVFFLLITDDGIRQETSANLMTNSTQIISNTSIGYDQPSRDERSLLIVMMLAVSNSVLDPLIYGCYLVKPIKSSCLCPMRSRSQTKTFQRAAGLLPCNKNPKSSIVRATSTQMKNSKRAGAVECEL
ncbi:unnamed protein product [Adineta ricciae]|uniref:G-protein coupled receptors family 1 profile domain-containing protein n=1 Tax=Adineta ricciae TaxID=249248 RepID=A0A815ANP4_ADIRI|nr:unnamed protein product [Adineta ricciae]CAF1262134.1 unnamed protein product [Adineta ricciae]